MSTAVRTSQLAIALLLGLSLPVHAQSSEPLAPLSNPEAKSDPFSSRGDNNGAIMQLIHRAMRGEGNIDRASEAAAQRENLSEAANDFFAKRNQLKKAPVLPPNNLPPASTNQPGSLKPATILLTPATSGAVTPSNEVTAGEPLVAPQPSKP